MEQLLPSVTQPIPRDFELLFTPLVNLKLDPMYCCLHFLPSPSSSRPMKNLNAFVFLTLDLMRVQEGGFKIVSQIFNFEGKVIALR